MKTQLRKEEKKKVVVLTAIAAVALVCTIFGVVEVINGSLIAVAYATACLYCAALCGEDAMATIEEAKRRDGNA